MYPSHVRKRHPRVGNAELMNAVTEQGRSLAGIVAGCPSHRETPGGWQRHLTMGTVRIPASLWPSKVTTYTKSASYTVMQYFR